MPRIIEIDDLSWPALAPYAGLTNKQLRSADTPTFIAESEPVIEAALEKGLTPLSMLAARRHVYGKAAALIEKLGDIPVYTGDDQTLAALTGYSLTRGVLCAFHRPPALRLEDVTKDARRLLILEDVFDETNMGAIMRSAAALGWDGLLLSPGCCDPLSRRAARVSMGAVCRVPWACVNGDDWPEGILDRLKAEGFLSLAMTLDPMALTLDEAAQERPRRLAVVLGNEGRGLRPTTIARCDHAVVIPMAHGVDSLNVAATAAIACYTLAQ